MSNKNKRLEDLERKAGGGEGHINWRVDWSESGFIEHDGEQLTVAEYRERFPDALIVTWDDIEDMGA